MDAGTDGKVEEDAPTLDPRVRDFVDTIFDVSMMKKQMEQQNIDLKKMPLGCAVQTLHDSMPTARARAPANAADMGACCGAGH